MTFRVGQKVVCVDASIDSFGRRWNGDLPVKGNIYTVSGITHDLCPYMGAVVGLQLNEISNCSAWEGAYAARRFRPVVERKTSISIFTSMLNPSKVDA